MFGQYRLGELLGRGGMGEVRRAFDTVRGRDVALKRLSVVLAADPEFEARFRREAALAARLHDPHIIPIHDFGEIDGRLFIDMRLVEGVDLATRLATGGPFAPDRAVALVAQIASALDTAHAAGLAHRDVKPSNVLLVGAGEPPGAGPDGELHPDDFVYLADFGIARAASDGSTSLTLTGSPVGSLDYMAPERFTGSHGDHRADVYSLGCVLFETLTGRRPFVEEGVPAMLHAHLNLPPPRPSVVVPGLPAAMDDVTVRAMAKDPDARYASAGALAHAARVALAGTPVGPAPPTLPSVPVGPEVRSAGPGSVPLPTKSRGRGSVLVTLVAALLLAAAGGGALAVGLGRRTEASSLPPTVPPTVPATVAEAVPKVVTASTAVVTVTRTTTRATSRPVARAPRIVGTSTYTEGVLVFLRISYLDPDGDAAGFGFRGANGSRWAEASFPFTSPSFGRVSPGRVDYPFNHACGQAGQYESDVQAWIYDRTGRRSGPVVVHLACS